MYQGMYEAASVGRQLLVAAGWRCWLPDCQSMAMAVVEAAPVVLVST